MNTDDLTNYGTVLSYAIESEDNELTFTDYGGFVLSVKGQKVVSTLFGGKKGNLGRLGKIPSKGVKRKGGFLRKAGKYAVIGLAGNNRDQKYNNL